MRNRNGSFFSGLAIGIVAGLLAGTIGVAHSATGRKAWDRFGKMFQAGYIAGFQDCVRLAKGMDPQGYVATNYILPRAAKPSDFQAWINAEYKNNPQAADRTIPQMLVLAGHKLQAKFGAEQPGVGSVQMQHMRRVIDLRRQAVIEAEQAKKDLEAAKAAEAADAAKAGDAAKANDAAKPGEATGAAPAATKTDATPAAPSGATPPVESPPAK